MSPAAQRLLDTFPWRPSEWTPRGILTSPADVESRVKVARLLRILVGLLAAALVYQPLVLASSDRLEGPWSLMPGIVLMLLEFGPEAPFVRMLSDREYPLAERLFQAVPIFFLAVLVVVAVAAVGAVWTNSCQFWALLAVSTVFMSVCPPEFRRFRRSTCIVAAVIAFAAAPGWWINYPAPQTLAGTAAFLALTSAELSAPIRKRDLAQPENVPPRPMQ